MKGFLGRLFKEIIHMPECKRYLIYLFKSKYDRIDFNYINLKNIYDIYK